MPFFAAKGIQYFVYIILYLLYSAILGVQIELNKGETSIADGNHYVQTIEEVMSQEMLYLISVTAVLVCGVIFFVWYRNEIRGEVRGKLSELFNMKNITQFVILGVGCQFFLSGGINLIKPIFLKVLEEYAENMEGLMNGNQIVVMLLLILIGPISEELIFRGVILHKTSKTIPFLGANILQALLFGIYHWNIVQGIYATLMGLLLGLVYHKFKTIFAPIMLHIIINASALLAMLFPNTVISYVVMVVLGGIFSLATLFLMRPFTFSKKVEADQVTEGT